MASTQSAGEVLGWLAGAALSPLVGAGAASRRARLFHPVGVLFRAEVVGYPELGGLQALAERLSGHALVRFSAALWKRREARPEVLGCAIRFGAPGRELLPSADDQDLLLATVRFPWTLALAPFSTHPHDFLDNLYYGTAPFEVPGLGRARIRLRCLRPVPAHPLLRRADELRRRVHQGAVKLRLELKRLHSWERWQPLVRLELREELSLDQEVLRFDPFRAGRGLVPRGFVHAMRRSAYPVSRAASLASQARSPHAQSQ